MREGRQTRAREAGFETRETGGARVIEGYFSVFGDVYDMGGGITESVDPHAFDGETSGDVRALIDHESRLVLGRTSAGTLKLRADARGLWGEIAINEADADAMSLYARVQRGDVTQCSFGFEILDEDMRVDPDKGSVHFVIKRVRLIEVSVVTFPAYEAASVSARAADRAQAANEWKRRMKARLKGRHGTQATGTEPQA